MGSERSIVARLRAEVGDFIAGMDRSAKAVEKVGTATEQASKKSEQASQRTQQASKADEQSVRNLANLQMQAQREDESRTASRMAAYDRLGSGALVAGGIIAAGIGFGVKAFADFDEAMSQASASLPGAGAEMGKLRQLAIDLGKDTKFSSTEAAQGITELAKAGVSAGDIYGGGLKGALDLAAAGGLDVARAAEIAGIAVKQFNLQGSDVPHVADLFAAAAGKAVGSVDDIAQAMKYAGVTASSLGIGIEETTGVIGLFAEKGIIGEQAGTSFRSMLLSLTAPSQVGRKAMEDLGIEVFDNSGKFVGLAGSAEQLKQRLGPLDEATRTAALGQIFGNESISAAIELYKAGGDGVNAWTAKVNDAGFAAEQAAKLTDNLKGDLERFMGAIDATAVQNGGGINGFLRSLTQNAEGAVESFGRLPGPVQQGVLGLGALTGAGLLAFGALSKVVTSGADLHESLTKIQSGGGRAAKGIDLATRAAKGFAAAAAAAALVAAFTDGDTGSLGVQQLTKDLLDAQDASDALDASISKVSDFGGRSDSGIESFGDAIRTAFDPSVMQQVDNGIGTIKSMFGLGNQGDIAVAADRISEIDQALTNLATSGSGEQAAAIFADLAEEAAAQGISLEQLQQKFPQYAEALAAADNQQTLAAGSGDKLTGALDETGDAAAEAEADLKTLVDQIRGFGSAADAAQSAESGFQSAIDDATASIKENGKTLDLHTEQGRANDSALRAVAEGAKSASAETFNLSGSQDAATAKMQEGRDAFIAAAIAAGQTASGAAALADKYGLIPEDVTTAVSAPGAVGATAEVAALDETIFRLDGKVVTVKEEGANPSTGRVEKMDAAIFGLKGKQVEVKEIGATASGDRVVSLKGKIYTLKGKSVSITANVSDALRDIGAVQSRLYDVRDKRVTLTVGTVQVGSTRVNAGQFADGGTVENYGGSLVRAFADGGQWDGSFRSAQPQIRAAGGAGVRWSEDGAGPWEAFISGHPAKLPRSRMIAEDTVGRLGGQVLWMKAFADGGVHERYASRPAAMSVSPVVNVTAPAGTASATVDSASIRAMAREVATQTAREVAKAILSSERGTALLTVSGR